MSVFQAKTGLQKQLWQPNVEVCVPKLIIFSKITILSSHALPENVAALIC